MLGFRFVRLKDMVIREEMIDMPKEEKAEMKFLFPFNCQVCQEEKGILVPRYQCVVCKRFVCDKCYENSKQAGFDNCHMCRGKLIKL